MSLKNQLIKAANLHPEIKEDVVEILKSLTPKTASSGTLGQRREYVMGDFVTDIIRDIRTLAKRIPVQITDVKVHSTESERFIFSLRSYHDEEHGVELVVKLEIKDQKAQVTFDASRTHGILAHRTFSVANLSKRDITNVVLDIANDPDGW